MCSSIYGHKRRQTVVTVSVCVGGFGSAYLRNFVFYKSSNKQSPEASKGPKLWVSVCLGILTPTRGRPCSKTLIGRLQV